MASFSSPISLLAFIVTVSGVESSSMRQRSRRRIWTPLAGTGMGGLDVDGLNVDRPLLPFRPQESKRVLNLEFVLILCVEAAQGTDSGLR